MKTCKQCKGSGKHNKLKGRDCPACDGTRNEKEHSCDFCGERFHDWLDLDAHQFKSECAPEKQVFSFFRELAEKYSNPAAAQVRDAALKKIKNF